MARYPLNLPVDPKKEAEQLAAEQGISLNQSILWSVSVKVGGLRQQQWDDPAFPHVTHRRGAGGRPLVMVHGTGVRSKAMVMVGRQWDLSPARIAGECGLGEAQVERLAFAQAHEKIAASIDTKQGSARRT